MSLEESDQAAAAVAVVERVTLDQLKGKLAFVSYATAWNAFTNDGSELHNVDNPGDAPAVYEALRVLTLCIGVTKSGFTVVGKSAPAAPENFDADLGKKFAYEDVLRQMWPLEGYLLREKLANA